MTELAKGKAVLVDLEGDGEDTKGGLGIQSVEIGMTLLTALSQSLVPESLANLARACAMSRTKAHRYLTSLERCGYIEREPGTVRYRLGGASVRLGLAALSQLDFTRFGSEQLAEVCQEVGETVFLSVWGQHGPTIVRWEDTGRPIAVNVRVGSVMPLIQSATGRVYGAFMPKAVISPFVSKELKAGLGTQIGIKTEAEATKLFAAVFSEGFGRATGSFLPGINSVAMPVFGESGKLVGAITALGLKGVFDDDGDSHAVKTLWTWSQRLSARLGAPQGGVSE